MKTVKQIKEMIDNNEIEWFGRDEFINRICDYLIKDDESKHICLKGIWGSGKTTTLLGMKNKLKSENILVLYLDAWKYENYEHPTYALLKAIQESDPQVYNSVKTKMKEKNLSYELGVNLPFIRNVEVGVGYSNENHKIISEAEYIEQFNKILVEVIQEYKKEKSNKLIIVVDELDRAKPEFALRLLETFHHLYDDLPTHFVYSADIGQLNSMIKHYYGYEYNTEIFLHKVFDEIIELEPLSKYEMNRYFNENMPHTKYSSRKLIELISQHMGAGQINSLRSVNYVLKMIVKNLNQGYFKIFNDIRYVNNYYLGEKKELLWPYVELLIILVIQSLTQPLLVQEIISGRQCDKLADYIIANDIESIYPLLYESYYADKSIEKKSSYIEDERFTGESKRRYFVEGLKNLFKPKTTDNNISVFENILL